MRLLRALAHLVLALAILTAGVAQARIVAVPAPAMSAHHGTGAPASAASDHAMHGAGAASDAHPVHDRDACQTACCFVPAQPAARTGDASPVAFRSVRYPAFAPALRSLTSAPEPGIPKPVA
jgi:hypothetical protein